MIVSIIVGLIFFSRALADLGHQAFCQHCHLDDLRILKTCSRCRLFKYCSLECQRADHPKHKVLCAQLVPEKHVEIRLELSRQTRERRLIEMAVTDSLIELRVLKNAYDLWFRILFALIDLVSWSTPFNSEKIQWFYKLHSIRQICLHWQILDSVVSCDSSRCFCPNCLNAILREFLRLS